MWGDGMAEVWDLYYPDGTPAGRTMTRGEKIPAGLLHLVCEVLVRHRDGDYLLMHRCASKPNYPDFWEGTAGGSALQGEDPLTCVRRELREETGIVWEDFEEVSRTVRDCYATIFYSYLCTVDWPKDRITLQEGETEDYQWLSEEEFIELLNSGRMIPGQPERMEGWFRKMGYLK